MTTLKQIYLKAQFFVSFSDVIPTPSSGEQCRPFPVDRTLLLVVKVKLCSVPISIHDV